MKPTALAKDEMFELTPPEKTTGKLFKRIVRIVIMGNSKYEKGKM